MKEKEYIILDLFSGAGGFSEGFKRAGFKIDRHFYSEIDKHAIACYKYNFNKSEYVGSVTDVPGITERIKQYRTDKPECGLIITFGSPCQDFSLAGKRAGMDGERSSLISRAIEIISILRPDVFVWENVKGAFSSNYGADFWAIIQAFTDLRYGRLEWQLLNTSWLLPQNRERIYLVGHLGGGSSRNVFPIGEDGLQNTEPQFVSPTISCREGQDNGTYLRYETGGGEEVGSLQQKPRIKIKSATNSGYEEATEGDSINLSQPNSETRRGRVGKGKAQTLETSCNQAVLLGAVKMERTEDGKKLRKEYEKGNLKHGFNEHRKETVRDDGLSNTLDSSEKSRKIAIKEGSCNQAVIEKIGNIYPSGSENGNVYSSSGISPTLKSGETSTKGNGGIGSSNSPKINSHDSRIRRLTEIECERLQGFKDDWTKYGDYDGTAKEISRTQRYKLMGNAVTVDVVKMIAERL